MTCCVATQHAFQILLLSICMPNSLRSFPSQFCGYQLEACKSPLIFQAC